MKEKDLSPQAIRDIAKAIAELEVIQETKNNGKPNQEEQGKK